MRSRTNILFLSYNGLLEPILPSQAVPYLKELSKDGFRFILLTYEKKKDLKKNGKDQIAKIRDDLGREGIEWRYLTYHKMPPFLSTFFDLAIGCVYTFYLIHSRNVRLVHIRGITPGIIMIILSKMIKVKMLFDMRGLLAEEYVGGGLWEENSVPFRFVKAAEKKLLMIADAVTVLTEKHLEHNKGLEYLRKRDVPMEVVPCSVDTSRFDYEKDAGPGAREDLGLKDRFILMYPGKIGTFYLIDEMLKFFKCLIDARPDSVLLIVTRDDPGDLLERAGRLGVDKGKIRIIRGIPFDEMPRYMKDADAGIFLINPYKKFGSSPIKMGEFLASGVPVIINPGVGDTEDLVRVNRVGVVLDAFDESCCKKAIAELFRLKKEGEVLKRRCRDTADRHLSLRDAVRKYRNIYNVLGGVK